MSAAVENVTVEDLNGEIKRTRKELAQALVRHGEAEAESDRAFEAEHFCPTEAANLHAAVAARQGDVDLLRERLAALERKRAAAQDRDRLAQIRERVGDLEGEAHEDIGISRGALDAIVIGLRTAADAVEIHASARDRLTNVRRDLEALHDQADVGVDVRGSTKAPELSRDEARFVEAAIAVLAAFLDRRTLSVKTGAWSEYIARRKRIESE